METIKVRRDGPKGFHIINKDDFNPYIHEALEDEPEKPLTVAQLKAELTESGVEYPADAKKQDLIDLLNAPEE